MNLVEGNFLNKVEADIFHGNGALNTMFRNYTFGTSAGLLNIGTVPALVSMAVQLNTASGQRGPTASRRRGNSAATAMSSSASVTV